MHSTVEVKINMHSTVNVKINMHSTVEVKINMHSTVEVKINMHSTVEVKINMHSTVEVKYVMVKDMLNLEHFYICFSLIVKGYRKSLSADDMFSLNVDDQSETLVPEFQKQWKRELELQKSKVIEIGDKTKEQKGMKDVLTMQVKFTPSFFHRN